MCGMCGLWGNVPHWSDAGRLPSGQSARPLAAVRLSQAAAISAFTRTVGVTVSDWMQSSWVVGSPAGAQEIVGSLPDVWRSADRLVGTRLDPLSPDFIAAMELRNGHRRPGE